MHPLLRRYGDPLGAAVLGVLMTVEVVAWADADVGRSVAYGLVATLPMALRRRFPSVAYLLAMGGVELLGEVQPGFDNDSMALVITFVWALYSLGRHARGLETWLGVGLLLVTMVNFIHGDVGIGRADVGDVAFVLAFAGAPWATGLTIRLRREREAVLGAENRRLVEEREELARRAVAEERARIARELHDVVSHAISVTVLQARGARRTLGHDDDQVRRALDAIEHTNTSALSDMRRLLAVLRDTEPDGVDDPDDRAPLPSLAHLDSLVEQVRASGLPVEVERNGPSHEVPPGVDLSAFRIVQEALTNVLKHAGPATAQVRLDYRPDELRVRIRDDGSAGDVNGTGHGLIGIRERVAVVGGEVTAAARDGGGFEVEARLPYSLELS